MPFTCAVRFPKSPTSPTSRAAPWALGLVLVATAPSAAPAADTGARAVTLVAGTQREIAVDAGVQRIAVADEAVATVMVLRKTPGAEGARLLVNGKSPGRTTLMVWPRGAAAATTYTIDVQRRGAVLEGQFASLPAHRVAREATASALPDKAVLGDRSNVNVRSHTVQVEVKVVEFNKNVLKQLGLNLFSTRANSHGFSFGVFSPSALQSSTLGPNGAIATEANNPVAQAFSLLFNFGRAGLGLNVGFLEGNGMARVLAEPTLVALSGQSASFLSGGELPIPVPQGLGTTSIEYKPFGIGLSVTPTVLADDRIVLKVAPEASDLDYANALSLNGVPVPAISTRRADTTVELGDGESFIIGGLVSRSTSSSVNKVPMLGDLPVLGAFFKQTNYQMNEKELVIVVTPHLVKPLARGTDLSARLPGAGVQRDAPVWRSILLGGAGGDAVPGFSR